MKLATVKNGSPDGRLVVVSDVPFPSEADGIDFEGESGFIVDEVPMGRSPKEALSHIKQIEQINDWPLRHRAQ